MSSPLLENTRAAQLRTAAAEISEALRGAKPRPDTSAAPYWRSAAILIHLASNEAIHQDRAIALLRLAIPLAQIGTDHQAASIGHLQTAEASLPMPSMIPLTEDDRTQIRMAVGMAIMPYRALDATDVQYVLTAIDAALGASDPQTLRALRDSLVPGEAPLRQWLQSFSATPYRETTTTPESAPITPHSSSEAEEEVDFNTLRTLAASRKAAATMLSPNREQRRR